jgi:hypothetical protein
MKNVSFEVEKYIIIYVSGKPQFEIVFFFLYTTNWNNFDARLLKIFCRHLKVKNSVNVVIVVRFIGVLSSQIFAV